MDVDAAYDIAKAILTDAASRMEQIQSEEDAKVQLITRIVTEGLGWDFRDIGNERPNENGFSDYVISHDRNERWHQGVLQDFRACAEARVRRHQTGGFLRATARHSHGSCY